jgi:membrane-bound metal-dependent hydrolase YbcI (DUF457 family)
VRGRSGWGRGRISYTRGRICSLRHRTRGRRGVVVPGGFAPLARSLRSELVLDRNRVIDSMLRPSAAALLLMAAVLFAADQALLHTGEGPWSAGPLDETAHLLTGALVLAALRGFPDRQFAVGLLVMSVVIDLDHVPGRLGYEWITRGTERPYSHSLLTLLVIGLLALAWRSRRPVLLGAIAGLAAHLARDLSESGSGVPLLWPWSYHSYTLPHGTYVAAIGAVLAVALWRARSERRVGVGVRVAEAAGGPGPAR